MKNKLIDLNNHLFEQLERLNNDSLKGESLEQEIKRSHAMGKVAQGIIGNARLALDAAVKARENQLKDVPDMLGLEKQ